MPNTPTRRTDGSISRSSSTLFAFDAADIRPTASTTRAFVDIGGLLSFGADGPASFRHGAKFVQRILEGKQQRDVPIEQPTKFELAINLKTAKAIGLTIPESFLLRADALIE